MMRFRKIINVSGFCLGVLQPVTALPPPAQLKKQHRAFAVNREQGDGACRAGRPVFIPRRLAFAVNREQGDGACRAGRYRYSYQDAWVYDDTAVHPDVGAE